MIRSITPLLEKKILCSVIGSARAKSCFKSGALNCTSGFEVIVRKPALLASWYELLASDASLAYAHKQRFPSLNLTASLSDSTDRVSDLFSPSSLAWSLLGSISAPIFEGGRLQANEEIARLNTQKQEQQYLQTLYDAFADVENAISQQQSLKAQYTSTLEAQKNALAAEQLSFEQYQSGLVTYTTVLDRKSVV